MPKNKVLVEKNSDVAPESKAVEQENEPEHFSPAKSQSVRKALATKRSTRAKKQTEEINENEVEAVAEPTPMTTTSTTRSGRGRKKASDKVLEEKATENTSNVEEQDVVVSKRKKRGVNAVVVQDTENVALSKENAVPESELAPTPTLKKRALPVAKKITRQTAALEPTLEDGHSDEEGATTGRRLRSLRKRV